MSKSKDDSNEDGDDDNGSNDDSYDDNRHLSGDSGPGLADCSLSVKTFHFNF